MWINTYFSLDQKAIHSIIYFEIFLIMGFHANWKYFAVSCRVQMNVFQSNNIIHSIYAYKYIENVVIVFIIFFRLSFTSISSKVFRIYFWINSLFHLDKVCKNVLYRVRVNLCIQTDSSAVPSKRVFPYFFFRFSFFECMK